MINTSSKDFRNTIEDPKDQAKSKHGEIENGTKPNTKVAKK
jgi:hypothetical protein